DDLLAKMRAIGPKILQTNKAGDSNLDLALRRASTLKHHAIFGEGIERNDWRKKMMPCLSIRCKHLSQRQLQMVATAVLRELQDLRTRHDEGQPFIPPYV